MSNLLMGCLRKQQMNQPASPQYLPAVDRQLEYQAELVAGIARPNPKMPVVAAKPRPWLGTDFTHIIMTR